MDFVFVAVVFAFSTFVKLINDLRVLQQNVYSIKRFLKYKYNNINYNEIPLIQILLVIFSIIFDVYLLKVSIYLMVFIFFINTLYNFKISLSKKYKKPLVFTCRFYRLLVTLTILYMLIVFLLISYPYYNSFSRLFFVTFILSCIDYLSYLLIIIAVIINYPFEKLIGAYYVNKAKKKLIENKELIKIAITGSYGKTTTKNFLNNILSTKYYPCMTPKSFNTPFGISKTVNCCLKNIHNVFISEMGAYKPREIEYLSKIVKPKYAILTSIGPQHLESFKTLENIIKTKFELINSLPNDGIAVLNYDDENIKNTPINSKCRVISVGTLDSNVDFYSSNIEYTVNGMKFDVTFPNKDKISFYTKILGKHNIINVLCAIAIAHTLDISYYYIQSGLNTLNQVEHRLQIRQQNNYTIIDDSFNANPVGTKSAVDLLCDIPIKGKRIIITPGMIELGKLQYKLNYEYGKYIAEKKCVDFVIIVGHTNLKALKDGLDKIKNIGIMQVDSIYDAFDILDTIVVEDSLILLANDLPDIYN